MTPTVMVCACGCGAEIRSGATYVRGHHWKVLRAAQGVPDEKVCERCRRTYCRSELASSQSNKHWLGRKFCSRECQEADLAERASAQVGEASPSYKGDDAMPQAGRMRARRMYRDIPPCEVCGDLRSERHHKDGNTLNNGPENIAFLCRRHHIRAEDRMAYRRKPVTTERMERKRALARERQRRYRERKRQEAAA